MGLKDRLNPFSDDEDDGPEVDVDTGFVETDEDIGEGETEDIEVEDDDSDGDDDDKMEWENAYDFAGWALEKRGFANVLDFTERAVFERIEDDPMYRDRLESGVRTLSTVRQAKKEVDEIAGNTGSDTNYGDLADELEDADRVVNKVRSLSGEDEVMVQQGMSLAQQLLNTAVSAGGSGDSDVDTSVERSDENI